jgi:hypothetical protein
MEYQGFVRAAGIARTVPGGDRSGWSGSKAAGLCAGVLHVILYLTVYHF